MEKGLYTLKWIPHHYRYQILTNIMQITLHSTNYYFANWFYVLFYQQWLEYFQTSLHRTRSHQHLWDKYLPTSNRRPTSFIAGINPSFNILPAFNPACSALSTLSHTPSRLTLLSRLFESPFPLSCAIRVQPLWKQWTQWTQWTVFSLICVLCGHYGRVKPPNLVPLISRHFQG